MKKYIIFLVLTCAVFSHSAFAVHFWRGKIMGVEQVKSNWGNVKFNKEKFKAGDVNMRSSMAYDLISSKVYVGKSRLEVAKDLGPGDGYYFSGMIPAYIINDPPKGSDVWQIVFLLDKNGIVDEVAVHKNCCDK